MASTSIGIEPTIAAHILEQQRRERLFFTGAAIALAIVCFLGFAPSYYLRTQVPSPPAMSLLLHAHGLAFTLWIVLLVTQTALVAADRRDIHRRLGVAGGVLAVAMMVLGAAVAVTRAKQGLLGQGSGAPPLMFLAIPFATLVVFPTLIGAALLFKARVDIHKRLMLIATVEIVTAALGRFPVLAAAGPPAFFGAADLFLVAMAIYDFVSKGRVHPATLWGGAFLIASQALRLAIASTSGWLAFATWITGA